MHGLNIDDFKSKPLDCTCTSSPFIYNISGHVITGGLNSINDNFAKGQKYQEPKSINWNHNWIPSMIMPDNGQT